MVEGDDHGLTGTLSLGPPFAGAETAAASVMNPEGGGVSAWPSANAQGAPEVAVREDFPTGAVQTGLVGGGAGGEVAELAVGRSSLGDGLVAWRQGPLGNAAIVAAGGHGAAGRTAVQRAQELGQARAGDRQLAAGGRAPTGRCATRSCSTAASRPRPAGVSKLRIDPLGLSSGRHTAQLLATDIDGQSTLSKPSPLLVDGAAPIVSIAHAQHDHGVSVRVRDPYTGDRPARRDGQLRRRPLGRADASASPTATRTPGSTGWSFTSATSSATRGVVRRRVSVR